MSKYAVEVNNVSMCFNLATEKIDTLKEMIIKKMKRKLSFDKFYAVNEVSFKIKKGDAFAIVGSNGSGKSTMLKMISGILTPTSGEIKVNGSIAPLIELGAGFDMDLTARENIFLNGAVLGYSRELMNAKFDEIIDFAGLQSFVDVPVKNFSSGMVARLGFAVATIVKPEILVVDEILSVGDQAFKKKCQQRMKELMGGGTTVILVSHSIDEVRSICKNAIWLEKSRLKCLGNVNEVYMAYLGQEYKKKIEAENSIKKIYSNSYAPVKNLYVNNTDKCETINPIEIEVKPVESIEIKNILKEKNFDPYEKRLYTPTYITKILNGDEEIYFIIDCWHHRVLYSNDVKKDIGRWSILTDDIAAPLSLATDGELYIIEDAGRNGLVVYKIFKGIFNYNQYMSDIGSRPHKTIYDTISNTFFCIASFSQNIVAIRNDHGTARIKYNYKLSFLKDNYVKSISIIDGKMYFLSANGEIFVCVYLDESYDIVEHYDVGIDINDLQKYGDFYYLTGNKTFIRFKCFESLLKDDYENLYDKLKIKGSPYFLNFFDGYLWVTEIDQSSAVKLVDISVDNIQVLFDFGEPNKNDIVRFCKLPK